MNITKFGAPWCGPCKMQDKILDELIAEGYDVEKINIDENEELAENNNIMTVPTILVLDENGQEVERFIGLTQKDVLIKALRGE